MWHADRDLHAQPDALAEAALDPCANIAFVLAAQSASGEKLAIEALDAAGTVLDRHDTFVA